MVNIFAKRILPKFSSELVGRTEFYVSSAYHALYLREGYFDCLEGYME